MSSDIMPCGCEGHMDNLDLCQYPALEQTLCGLAFALGMAEAEKADLRLDLQDVQAIADGQARRIYLKQAGPGPDGSFEMTFGNAWAAPIIADSLASMFVSKGGAPNYVEFRLYHPEAGPMVCCVQRARGKTPHEARREAEAERDALRKVLGDLVPLAAGLLEWANGPSRFGDEEAEALGYALDRGRALLGSEPNP